VTISEEGLRIGSCGKGTGGPEAGEEQEQHSGGQTFGKGTQRFKRRARARKSRHRTWQGNSGWRWEWGKRGKKMGFSRALGASVTFLLKTGQASKVNSYSKLVAIPDGWIKQSIMLDTRNCN
jgi:hypothetical protein